MVSLTGSILARSLFPAINLVQASLQSSSLVEYDKRTPLADLEHFPTLKKTIGKIQKQFPNRKLMIMHGICWEGLGVGRAKGNNLTISSPRCVFLDSTIMQIDPNVSAFWLHYSFEHIRNNDIIVKYSLLLVINVAASIFCSSIYSVLLIGVASHFAVQHIFCRFSENRAFAGAFAASEEHEILGAWKLFSAKIDVERKTAKELTIFNRISKWIESCLFGKLPLEELKSKAEKILLTRYRYKSSKFSEMKNDPLYDHLFKYLLIKESFTSRNPDFDARILKLLEHASPLQKSQAPIVKPTPYRINSLPIEQRLLGGAYESPRPINLTPIGTPPPTPKNTHSSLIDTHRPTQPDE